MVTSLPLTWCPRGGTVDASVFKTGAVRGVRVRIPPRAVLSYQNLGIGPKWNPTMCLYDGMLTVVRRQLQLIAEGKWVSLVEVGCLTDDQHRQLCEFRERRGLPKVESPQIVYLGRHHYDSRVVQGYTINDLVQQLEASTVDDAKPMFAGKMTSLLSPRLRADGYGRMVRDQAVLELTARKPRVEVFSVIPKGDGLIPKTTKPR